MSEAWSDPNPSVPELREAWREVMKDASPDARHALSKLVDSHDRWVLRASRAATALKRADRELSNLLDEDDLPVEVEDAIQAVRAGIKDVLAENAVGGER